MWSFANLSNFRPCNDKAGRDLHLKAPSSAELDRVHHNRQDDAFPARAVSEDRLLLPKRRRWPSPTPAGHLPQMLIEYFCQNEAAVKAPCPAQRRHKQSGGTRWLRLGRPSALPPVPRCQATLRPVKNRYTVSFWQKYSNPAVMPALGQVSCVPPQTQIAPHKMGVLRPQTLILPR